MQWMQSSKLPRRLALFQSPPHLDLRSVAHPRPPNPLSVVHRRCPDPRSVVHPSRRRRRPNLHSRGHPVLGLLRNRQPGQRTPVLHLAATQDVGEIEFNRIGIFHRNKIDLHYYNYMSGRGRGRRRGDRR
jgi:hypothetical protein